MGAFHLLALEDNEEYQKVLRSMLSKYPGRSRLDVDIISGVTTFEALMASDDRVDIFVTDIDLGESNPSGIELVSRYFPAGSSTQVVYISGHVEYCTSVYQTEHTYFLLKPINQSDFDAALDKALSNLQDSRQLPVAIQHNGTVTMVDPAEVEFVESERRKVRLHSVRGECIETYATLGQMLDMLPECFVRAGKCPSASVNARRCATRSSTTSASTRGRRSAACPRSRSPSFAFWRRICWSSPSTS